MIKWRFKDAKVAFYGCQMAFERFEKFEEFERFEKLRKACGGLQIRSYITRALRT